MAGLTYTALHGKRKQSVTDAEKLSTAVADWCKKNSCPEGGQVIEITANWHKASDGHGLDEEARKKYNAARLDYISEHLMPWYKENKEYFTLDPVSVLTLKIGI